MSWAVIFTLLAIGAIGVVMIWNQTFFPPAERDPYADLDQARADLNVGSGL